MRIERLAVEGFGPFATRQEVDFRELDAAGLFLITGRTGTGKSSVLDAVCFALYGSAPRYDGGQARLRSDHAALGTPTRVELEFAVAGERWRVTRSPEFERPKKHGTGTTVQPQAASLERWDGDGWAGVAARPVDVAEHLEPVLQLTREQFLQVILLAQGRFQEFLRARSEDRLGLLRALFGTDRFSRFEAEIAERAKALEQALGARTGAVTADVERLAHVAGVEAPAGAGASWAEELAVGLATRERAAEEDAGHAQAAYELADEAAARAAVIADRQRRRAAALSVLADLEAARAAVDSDRARVAEAVGVLPLLPHVEAFDRAAAGVPRAVEAARAAEAALGAAEPDPEAAGGALDALIGALAGPLADERALPALTAAAARARSAADEAQTSVAALTDEAAALPARRDGLVAERSRAEAAASAAQPAEAALERARRIRTAVGAAERAAEGVAAAEHAVVRALDEEQAATARTRALLTARLAGAAGLLADELVDGVPCPVCGAAEHPAPARGDGTTPDDVAIARAEADQQAAADRRAEAGEAAAEARSVRAAAAAAAEGATRESAAAAVRDAENAVIAARAGVAERGRLSAALDRLAARADELQHAIERARDAASAAAEARSAAGATLAAASARVADGREGAPTVAARVAALTSRRAALRALEEARRRAAAARDAQQEARARLDEALAEAEVADAAAVRAAALSAPERRALEQRVRDWQAASDGAQAQLADPDVASAPPEPVDVPAADAAKVAALTGRVEAGDRLADARSRASAAHTLAAAIAAAERESAGDRERLAVIGPLAQVVRGGGTNALRMRLESYVLAARLEQIVAAANQRLAAMTDGRFTLRHDDSVAYRNARSGLGLEVLDEHTGRPRSVASLSGGETFLASLALALGLAEVVSAEAGGVRLDTLFVDEGFGSLDRRTLETAMETLDSLRAGGRTVGLISHVEAMQEAVPAGLHIERLPDGSSTIRSRVPA